MSHRIEINELDLAWLAGLLEGEGCFTVHKNCKQRQGFVSVSHVARLKIETTDEDVVRCVASLIGGNFSGPRKQSVTRTQFPGTSKMLWTAEVTGWKALAWMRVLLPWMCDRRAARIQEVLSMRNYREYPDGSTTPTRRFDMSWKQNWEVRVVKENPCK